LRYDHSKCGKLNKQQLKQCLNALHCTNMEDDEVELIMKWFDSDGTDLLDIEQCTAQLAGSDCLTRPLKLPEVPKPFINTHLAHTPGDSFGPSMLTSMHHAYKFGSMPGM
jgi:hypothetical protein